MKEKVFFLYRSTCEPFGRRIIAAYATLKAAKHGQKMLSRTMGKKYLVIEAEVNIIKVYEEN